MSEPFMAEIRIFPYTFAPRNWSWCNGQSVRMDQFTALFSLLGTIYGGDGRTTFQLPDLKGRAPMHYGRGPGLPEYRLGQQGGTNAVSLSESEIPSHPHTANASIRQTPDKGTPAENRLTHKLVVDSDSTLNAYSDDTDNLVAMSSQAVSTAGQGAGHENRQPFLNVNFCIAMEGIYPSRS